MIWLNPEVASGLGEDTFWTWFKREVPESSFLNPRTIVSSHDVVLQYSTKGTCLYPKNTIALLWELYPEMKIFLNSNEWDGIISKIDNCAASAAKRVVSSNIMLPYYQKYGSIDLLPIGVNTDLFKEMNKLELRKKYNIPIDKTVGIWCGTTHRMKGFENFRKYALENSNIYWIVVWKQQYEAGNFIPAQNYVKVPQQQLAELINCSDFFLSCGLLRPYFMVEWEAMACNVPVINISGLEKDFVSSQTPRQQIFDLGWDRNSAKLNWLRYIEDFKNEKN